MPKPDISRLMDNKEDIAKILTSLYQQIEAETIDDPQRFIDDIYALGQILSNSFDGAGEHVGNVSATGLLADDIAQIMLENKAVFPKPPHLSDAIVPELNNIFDDVDILYSDWASSWNYDMSTPEENALTNAALDNFKKGIYTLFELTGHKNKSKITATNSSFQEPLFNALIAKEENQILISALESIQTFLKEQPSIAPEDPLVKLEKLLTQYKNMEISSQEFVDNIDNILSHAEVMQNNQHDNAGYLHERKSEDELDDGLTDTASISSNETVSHNTLLSFTLTRIQDTLKTSTIETSEKAQRQNIIKELGITALQDALTTLDPNNEQTKILNDLVNTYVEGKISLDITKEFFHNFYKNSQMSDINKKSTDPSARKMLNKFNPFTKNRTAIMDKMKEIDKKLAQFNGLSSSKTQANRQVAPEIDIAQSAQTQMKK